MAARTNMRKKDEFDERWEELHRDKRMEATRARTRMKRTFVGTAETVAVGAAFLGSNTIARFLAAKVSLDIVVEVTARFGPQAGHNLSTLLAAVIAEPRLIAAIAAGFFLVVDGLFFIAGKISAKSKSYQEQKKRIEARKAAREIAARR